MADSTRITPEVDKIYENKGGGTFKCLSIDEEMSLSSNGVSGKSAVMQNVTTGWTLLAHGVNLYEDGKIDWEFSTQGRFEPIETSFVFKEGDYVAYTTAEGEEKSGFITSTVRTDDNKLMYVIEDADRNIPENNVRYMTWKEFLDTPTFEYADTLRVVDGSGVEVDSDWVRGDALIVGAVEQSGELEVVIGFDGKTLQKETEELVAYTNAFELSGESLKTESRFSKPEDLKGCDAQRIAMNTVEILRTADRRGIDVIANSNDDNKLLPYAEKAKAINAFAEVYLHLSKFSENDMASKEVHLDNAITRADGLDYGLYEKSASEIYDYTENFMAKNPIDYTKVFEDMLRQMDFALVKHLDGYGLSDLQGANLGNIEAERYTEAFYITDRLIESYINDSFFNDLEEEARLHIPDYSSDTLPTTAEEWTEYMDKYPYFKYTHIGDYEVMDMLARQEDKVNLEAIVERNNAYTYDKNDIPQLFAEIDMDEGQSAFYKDSKGTIYEIHTDMDDYYTPSNTTKTISPAEAISKIEKARETDDIITDYTPEIKAELQKAAKEAERKNGIDR